MQTFRWTARLALLALVLAAACSKSSDDAQVAREEVKGEATAEPTAQESGAEATEPAEPAENEGKEPAALAGDSEEGEGSEAEDDPAARLAGPEDEDRELVNIGAPKKRIVPQATKTIADNDQYTLKLALPSGVAKNADGKVKVLLTPQKGWKLNREFPTKLTVEPPAGVEVAKKSQGVDDAVSWHEKKGGTWAVGFSSGSSGDKKFTGKFKFAVCTETSCIPKGEELAFSVKVK